MKLKTGVFTLIALVVVSTFSQNNVFAESSKVTVTVNGLEVGDRLELYRVASYSQKSKEYNWDSTVKNWMNNDEVGHIYQNISPAKLEEMTEKRQTEFCQAVLVGLKNEKDGVANLAGYSLLTDDTSANIDADSGYYIILPKGINRIYEIKWAKVDSTQGSVSVEYGDGDYQKPKAEVKSEILGRDDPEADSIVVKDEEIRISGKISIPAYPNMYATGKRIFNATFVIPMGLEYDKEDSDKKMKLSLSKDDVSEAVYNDVHIYENQNGDRLFFGTMNGYYFEMTGAALVSDGTLEEAIAKYNELHETEYRIQAEAPANNEDGTESLNEQADTETMDTEKGPEVTELEADDESLYLKSCGGNTVIILSVDTETTKKSFDFEYVVKKNENANDKGKYDNTVYTSYSVSPLDANLINIISQAAAVDSYGIRIVLRKGNARSYLMSADEKFKKLDKLTGATFYLYKYVEKVEGEENEETSIDKEDMSYRDVTIYDEENQQSIVYKYIKTLDVNDEGEASIAGLEPDEYLVVQKQCPEGYSLTNKSILIEKEDWSNDELMDGNGNFDLLWLDYETVYLPGTGKRGIGAYVALGIILSGIAIIIMIKKNKFYFL